MLFCCIAGRHRLKHFACFMVHTRCDCRPLSLSVHGAGGRRGGGEAAAVLQRCFAQVLVADLHLKPRPAAPPSAADAPSDAANGQHTQHAGLLRCGRGQNRNVWARRLHTLLPCTSQPLARLPGTCRRPRCSKLVTGHGFHGAPQVPGHGGPCGVPDGRERAGRHRGAQPSLHFRHAFVRAPPRCTGLWEVSCGVSAASGTSRRWVTVPAAAVDCAASRAWTPHPPPFCTCLRCAAGNGTAPLYQTNAMVSVLPILLLFFIPM